MTATPRHVALRLAGGAMVLVVMTVVGLLLVTSGGSPDSGAASSDRATTPTSTVEPSDSDAGVTDSESGPGRSEPGVDLQVSVTPDGAFDVHETVRLARPTDVIRLATPALGAASEALRGVDPRATTVQMSADGDLVTLDPDTVADMRAVSLEQPVETFTLHYLLEDAAVYTANSTPGRALGAVAPLSRGLSPTLPVRMTFTDPDILNVTCPMLRGARQLCSRAAPDGGFLVSGLKVERAVALLQIEMS